MSPGFVPFRELETGLDSISVTADALPDVVRRLRRLPDARHMPRRDIVERGRGR